MTQSSPTPQAHDPIPFSPRIRLLPSPSAHFPKPLLPGFPGPVARSSRPPQGPFTWGQVWASSSPLLPTQLFMGFFPESLPLTLHSKIPLQTHSLSADHFFPNIRKWGPTGMKPPELPSLYNPPHLPLRHFSPFCPSPVEPEPFIKLTSTLGLSPATCTGSVNLLLVLKLLPHPWLPSTLPCWFSHSTYHIWHMTHFIYLIFNCLSLLRPFGATLSTP